MEWNSDITHKHKCNNKCTLSTSPSPAGINTSPLLKNYLTQADIDIIFSIFVDFKHSKTGQWEGLGAGLLSQALNPYLRDVLSSQTG